ncbi:MAG: acyl carrier protein [Nanoarchaeota archaeon]
MTTSEFDPKDLYNIIAEHLGVDREKVTLDAHLTDDLGADSLDATELIMVVEEHYKLEIPDEDAQKFKYVRDIVDYLTDKGPYE